MAVTYFEETSFKAQPDISIDYAVMERAEKVVLVPASFGWSDVGSWDSLANAYEADNEGNSSSGTARCNSLTLKGRILEGTSHTEKMIATIGVENMFIVDTPDALLVADRSKSQEVKLLVEGLEATEPAELTELPATVHRPWGTFATLKQEAGYQVKRIVVLQGQKMSLQYHHNREEHWVVTQGKGNGSDWRRRV